MFKICKIEFHTHISHLKKLTLHTPRSTKFKLTDVSNFTESSSTHVRNYTKWGSTHIKFHKIKVHSCEEFNKISLHIRQISQNRVPRIWIIFQKINFHTNLKFH